MNRSDTPTLLIPLLALLAIAFPFAMYRTPPASGGDNPQASQSTEREANRPAEESEAEPQPHSAAKLVEDFLHAPADREIWPDSDPRHNYSLDFMIAIVADPIDSRLSRIFDTSIDSIQRAFETAGYELDRFDLAWSQPTSPTTTAKSDKAGEAGPELEAELPRYRRLPGLLLFRKPPDLGQEPSDGKLFLVFVVGETPTSGIHKAAMASALLQLAHFFKWGPGPNGRPDELYKLAQKKLGATIKIMGPSFSGSATSLEFALRDWLARLPKDVRPNVKLRIVSGSATSIEPEEFCKLHAGGPQTFQAVVPQDRTVMPVIFNYIYGLGFKHAYTRIAMLRESGTAYGQANISPSANSQQGWKGPRPSSSTQAQSDIHGANGSKAGKGGSPWKVINLPFPLHISQLRTESEKLRSAQQKSTSERINNPAQSIHLNSGEASQPKETPPSFSNLGAPSSELVLSGLLSTISREEIHAVGILATDMRDIIFLAREIHQHCPGTLVFTVTSDVLFSHPDVGSAARGMLVFTPYPLYNLNQVWTPLFLGRGNRVQFPSQDAEGVYNATLALLCRKDLLLDYGDAFPSHPTEQGFERETPALWVTVVGRNGPLPVRTLYWYDSEKYSIDVKSSDFLDHKDDPPEPPTLDEEGIYTSGSALAVVLLSVVLFVFSFLIVHEYHLPVRVKEGRRSGWTFRLLGDPATLEYRRQARLFLFAGLICLLSFYLVVISAYTLPAFASCRIGTAPPLSHWHWWIVFVMVAIPIAAGLLSLVRAGAVVFHDFRIAPYPKSFLPVVVKRVVIGGCLIVLVLSLRLATVWFYVAWTRPPEGTSTYVRAFQFFSGLSPLAPLFCLALAGFLWALCSFRRLRMIDGLRLAGGRNKGEVSVLAVKTQSFNGLEILETTVWERLERASAFSTVSYCVLVVVGFVTAMYLFFCPFVPSYEGTGFYFLFGWGFFLVYAALASEFGRLCLAWDAFRRLLQRLAVHPMQAAYERYHKSFPGLPRIDLAMPDQDFSVLEFSVSQAERLLRLAQSLRLSWDLSGTQERQFRDWILEAQRAVPKASRKLSQALRADAEGRWCAAVARRSQSQQALGKLAQSTANLLEPSWRATMNIPPFPGGTEFKEFRDLGEEFLVGRVVLLICYVLPSLRKLGTFILTGLLLMLFSVMFYPFVQKNHFLAFNWIVILAFVVLALLVTIQMERDVVLSALNGTKPGQVQVTRQFTFRVLTYVMVPIFVLLSAQFPDTLGQIISWFTTAQGH